MSLKNKQHSYRPPDETAIICVWKSNQMWLLISDKRIVQHRNNETVSILFTEIKEITYLCSEQVALSGINIKEYLYLKIITKSGESYIIETEKGDPFVGIFQVLHSVVISEI